MRNILQSICFKQKRFSTAPKKKLNKLRTKRGKRKSVKRKYQSINEKEKKMYILGENAAGLFNKLESFDRNISLLKPGVFFIQESKGRQKNKVKLNDYVIFEHIRNPDLQIMVQPGSLAARKYSSSQKLFRTYPAVCQIYL